MMFGESDKFRNDKIYYESDGRMFKKEPFIKQIPRYTFVSGKFTGKFYSDLEDIKHEREEFFSFKIYEAEVEITSKSKIQEKIKEEESDAITVSSSQMPEKVYFFEKVDGERNYYNLKFENPEFRNFKFISKLQQNEGKEAFGTIEADFYGYLIDFLPEKRYRKIYRHINLVKCDDCIKTSEKTGNIEKKIGAYREEYYCRGKKQTFWGDWIEQEYPVKDEPIINDSPLEGGSRIVINRLNEKVSPCLRNLILASLLTIISLIFGFTPLFVIGLFWLFYVVYRCYFSWLRYLAYLFGLLFLIGLVYSVFNTDWNRKTSAYIPHPVQKINEKPQLVKVITLLNDNNQKLVQLQREISWYGYNGEKYSGIYSINKVDLDLSRNMKNSLDYRIGYNSIIYNISSFDSEKLSGVYEMFDKIKIDRKLNDKQFAEMVVSFAQYIPYYAVVEGSCNPSDYKDRNTQNLLIQNAGRCSPNQKFGITTPLEFLATSQGDCDSRTVLLYTILKHYNYNVAVFSSEVYAHSVLGIALPYNGLTYETGSGKYVLWETTDRGFKPGILPLEVMNLNNWNISLK